MRRESLLNQIQVVIDILEAELNKDINRKGVYKELLKKYTQAKEVLLRGENYNDVRIVGGVRYFVDNLCEENIFLVNEMGKAEDILRKLCL